MVVGVAILKSVYLLSLIALELWCDTIDITRIYSAVQITINHTGTKRIEQEFIAA